MGETIEIQAADGVAEAYLTGEPGSPGVLFYVDAIGLGYEVRTSPERTFPAYAGSVNLQYASVPK